MRWFFDTSQTDVALTHSVHGRTPASDVTYDQAKHVDTQPDDEMSISQVAEMFDVTMRTLRFYEEKQLLHPRRVGNRRFYDENCRTRLSLVLKGKSMGLGLDAIASLVCAVESKASDGVRAKDVRSLCEEQRELLVERRQVLDTQIEETQRALAELDTL